MMNRILLTIALMGASLMASAEYTATEAFTSAPRSVFPLLDTNTRLDMVDYYNSGLATPSNNMLDGNSTVTSITPAIVDIDIAESAKASVVVLNRETANPVVMVIFTLASPGLDSQISFYDRNWTQLPTDNYLKEPAIKDWLNDKGKKMEGMVTAVTPFILSSAKMNEAATQLTLTNNLSYFLDKDVYTDIAPALNTSLTYNWDGKKFNLAK